MTTRPHNRPVWLMPLAIVAIVFGIASLISGGRVLFGPPEARAAAGEVVGFVVWFNVLTSAVYVAAGVALMIKPHRGAQLAAVLAAAIAIVLAGFALHAMRGGAYENRTALAMLLRTALWTTIAVLACRTFGCFRPATP